MLEPQVIASKKGSKPHTDLDFSLSHKLELSCKSWSQVVPQMGLTCYVAAMMDRNGSLDDFGQTCVTYYYASALVWDGRRI